MLTPAQLNAIDCYLKKCGIIYEEVYNELVDHFINAIEAEVTNHTSFDDALEVVSRQFGGRKGLAAIQTRRNKSAELHYRRSLQSYLLQCVQGPNSLLTVGLAWLLYKLIGLVPTMMFLIYPITVISAIPFLMMTALTGWHLWQFKQHNYSRAWSLEGFTLLSKSFSTVLSLFYPTLFIQLGLIIPKNKPLNPTEHIVYFVLTGIALFLSFVQIKLIIRYAKSINKMRCHLLQ